VLFDHNISNNAIPIVYKHSIVDLSSKYILVTDGDLVPQDGWHEEQCNILERCSEVFACAIGLSDANLPITTFPEAKSWVPPPSRETDLYREADTGHHLVLMRTTDFVGYMNHATKHGTKYVDTEMHRYCRSNGKRWVTTKNTKAIHLTWNSYNNLEHPYTKLKLSKSLVEHWNHSKSSDFTVYTKNGARMVKT
jgi:hypothetical protein